MTEERSLDWLAQFQARFGAMLRTPLDRRSGTLRATPAAYDGRLRREALAGPTLPATERLAVYNRQYWFRLFGVLQSAFPLTTRLVGHWHFNAYAARFLSTTPPNTWSIDHVSDGFVAFFEGALTTPLLHVGARGETVDRDALLEAARIDDAWRRVFLAPAVAPYRPSADDAARLPHGRLRPSPTATIVREHWPLLELRRSLLGDPGETAVPLPAPHDEPRSWALVRRPGGIGQLPLADREAQLFALLAQHPVGEALARLESACRPEELPGLPAKTQSWLARSVELDFWSGLDD